MKKDDDIYDMYGSEETPGDAKTDNSSVLIRRKGAINELVTENDSILIPDPVIAEKMMKTITDLQKRIGILEQNSRSQTSRIFQMERHIQKLTQELDKKISYE